MVVIDRSPNGQADHPSNKLAKATAKSWDIAARLLALVGNRFHQSHHLALHGLALDAGIGPQQPQAERAVEKQQAFDLPGLAVAVVEESYRHIEGCGNLLQAGRSDAVDAFLVFLNLLKAHSKLFAEIGLRDSLFDAPQTDLLSHLDVRFSGAPLLHFFTMSLLRELLI